MKGAPRVVNRVYYQDMETNTCQHCSGKVEFGMTEQGFRGFVHVETGTSVCPTDPDYSEMDASTLFDHFTELDGLLEEARGDHPALAEVRAQIVFRMDKVEAELRARHEEVLLDTYLDDVELAMAEGDEV